MSARIPEILAPAGSPEALQAAVRCGAAAVYLGVSTFNARQNAHNFSPDELADAVRYCHARNVRVHLTLNTLVRDDELDAALDTAALGCRAGVDALIVQDTGLARILRTAAPEMPLHASTQLSCHTPAGVRLLRDAGFTRVVLSREMSREEIAACAGQGVELEVFVHGALCMSVSGQCYFSAMLGGRSGNRGLCAQTCRLPFTPTSGTPHAAAEREAALSLKDSCLYAYTQELAQLGVTSLKIEGRMKRPEYVAAATAVYHAAAHGDPVDSQALADLQSVFSRSGFTDGYYTHRLGGEMFGTRRKEDVTAAAGVLGQLAHRYDQENPLIPVTLELVADTSSTRIIVRDTNGHAVTAVGEGGEPARTRPLDPTRAEEQLQKTGGTPFYAVRCQVQIGEGLTLPLSRINALRREALERLLEQRAETDPLPFSKIRIPAIHPVSAPPVPHSVARLADARQYSPAMKADRIFLPLNAPAETIEKLVQDGQAVGVEIPRGLFGTEGATAAALRSAAAAGATAALCGNVGALPLAIAAGLCPVGGFGLNLMNSQALAFYAERGLTAATLSMELTFAQIRALRHRALPVGLLLYGRQPLMLTRNCPRKSALDSCVGCHGQGITDRTDTAFPVMCAGGCSEVLNSVPLWWGDRMAEVPPVDFYLFHFTDETAEQAAQVLRNYCTGAPAPDAITRGLYRRGVQ